MSTDLKLAEHHLEWETSCAAARGEHVLLDTFERHLTPAVENKETVDIQDEK